jgi:hypothetical protein
MSKIGLEIKITLDDANALVSNPAVLDVLKALAKYTASPEYMTKYGITTPEPSVTPEAAPTADEDTLSAADLRDLALEEKLRQAKAAKNQNAPAAKQTRRTSTPVPPPAPVNVALKQGDKTTTIRNFVLANPDGVTPKEILRHLRDNFAWARESTTLANTVHTSLNNMQKRGIIKHDEQRRTYVGTGEPVVRASGKVRRAQPAAEPVTAEVESTEAEAVAVETPAVVETVVAAPAPRTPTFTDEELDAKVAELRANRTEVPSLFNDDA